MPLPPIDNDPALYQSPLAKKLFDTDPPPVKKVEQAMRANTMDSPLVANNPDWVQTHPHQEVLTMDPTSSLSTHSLDLGAASTSFTTVESLQSTNVINMTLSPIDLNEYRLPLEDEAPFVVTSLSPKGISTCILHRWIDGVSIDRGPLLNCGSELQAKAKSSIQR